MVVFLVVIFACGECLEQSVASSTDESKLSRERALDADLDEAIEMLQQKKHLILYYDFLPVGPMAMDPGRGGVNPQNPMRGLPPEFSATLLAQLTAAKTSEKTFNRSRTLVQTEYIIKPAEHIPSKPPEGLPASATKPSSEVSGLGGNLTEVLASIGEF